MGDDGKAARAAWQAGMADELGWWEKVIAGEIPRPEPVFKAFTEDSDFPFEEDVANMSDKEIVLLELGPGPHTRVGTRSKSKKIRVVPVDPRADAYRRLFSAKGFRERVPSITLFPEDLLTKFKPGTFNIASSANFLDQTYDPPLAIKNVYETLKPGGVFYILGEENLGAKEQYAGNRKWNFAVKGDDMEISAPGKSSLMVRSLLPDADIEARRAPQIAPNWLYVSIRKPVTKKSGWFGRKS